MTPMARRGFSRMAALPLVLVLAAACSSSKDSSPPPAAPMPAASSAPGPFTVSGTLPAAIGGIPSIVIFEAAVAHEEAAPPLTPVMDQQQQSFIPQMLMVRTGQPVEFRNNDEVLHNVRVQEVATHSPAFNVAIPTGEKYMFTFPRDGFYQVGCDIHPEMAAQVVATQSPYTAVAEADGAYTMPGVPAGQYKGIVYTGTLKVEREVTIAGGRTRFDLDPAR